jgi:hypothetical protein
VPLCCRLYLVQEYCDASLHAVMGAHILHDPVTRKPNMDLVLTVLLDIARWAAGAAHLKTPP